MRQEAGTQGGGQEATLESHAAKPACCAVAALEVLLHACRASRWSETQLQWTFLAVNPVSRYKKVSRGYS